MRVLNVLYNVLPRPLYQGLYQPAFAVYQKLLRAHYWCRWMARYRSLNAREKLKKKRVHAVMPFSLVGAAGLEHSHDKAREVLRGQVPGAFVECGVAQGGCAALLAMVAAEDERLCWFFDSFAGLPDPTENDFQGGRTGAHVRPLPRGSCCGGIDQVAHLLFDRFGIHKNRVRLVAGWFQDTCPAAAKEVGPIAFLRIDGDWYESTRLCLEVFYDQVAPGGCVLIDDYFSCYGARRATDEFLRQRGLEVRLTSDGRGGCSFHKPVPAAPTAAPSRLVESVA